MKIYFLIIVSIFFLFSCVTFAESGTALGKTPDGTWLLEIHTKDIGVARALMTLETDEGNFRLFSREGFDRQVLGWWKSFLARTFTSNFKNGCILRIENGKITYVQDSCLLKGIFASSIGNYYFLGVVHKDRMKADLLDGRMDTVGFIEGKKYDGKLPLDNYSEIVNKALSIAEDKIYNPNILKTGSWKDFKENITEISNEVNDDIELIFAFYYFARRLPFSHFALMEIDTNLRKTHKNNNIRYTETKELNQNTCDLKISSFEGGRNEIDSVMNVIINKHYSNLIIDLTDNPGGNITPALTLATYLFDSARYGGIFLTQKWFRDNNTLPTIGDYSNFKTLDSSSFDLLIAGIHNEKGIVLQVIPNKIRYLGKLFVIINNNTASTCEPLVYGLKQYGRALLIGGKTAGAMLNGEMFDVNHRFKLFVPTADYYTSDGTRIDNNGVSPNIEIEPKEAKDYILKKLVK